MNCIFCELDKTEIENTIICNYKYFFVKPALGSLVDGYLLIICKRHINSMSELNEEEREEYKFILKHYRRLFKNIYKDYPIIFEHGSPNICSDIKANSVDHAHTHIVNHRFLNEKLIISKYNFKKIKSIDNIKSEKNYILYLNNDNNLYITTKFPSTGQLMRKLVAIDLGIEELYDWRKVPFFNNINSTIQKFNNFKSISKFKE